MLKKTGIAIFLLALLMRLIFFFAMGKYMVLTAPAGMDGLEYHCIALNIVNHHFYSRNFYVNEPRDVIRTGKKPTVAREPGYPFFIAAIYSVFGPSSDAVRLIQIILSSFVCVITFILGCKIFNKATGLLAGLISSCYPYLVYYASSYSRETFYAFLLIMSVYSLYRYIESKRKLHLILLGVFLGISNLTNMVSAAYVFCIFVLLAVKKFYKEIVILACILLAIQLPWIIRNYIVYKAFIPGACVGGQNMYLGIEAPFEDMGTPREQIWRSTDKVVVEAMKLNEIEQDRFFYKSAFKRIIQKPFKLIARMPEKLVKMYRFYPYRGRTSLPHNEKLLMFTSIFSYGIIFPFFIYGFIISFKRFSETVHILLPIMLFTFVYMITMAILRYRLPIESLIIILACYGIVNIYELISGRKIEK